MLYKAWRFIRKEGLTGVIWRLRAAWLERRRPDEVVAPYGVRLKSNWGDQTFRFYLRGSYGTYLSDLIASVHDEFAFIDIGANQGLYTLLAARNNHCQLAVAFEPASSVFSLLEQNVELNNCRQVVLRQEALADRECETTVSVDPGHTGRTSVVGHRGAGDSSQAEIIRCVTHAALDELAIASRLRVLVKVDVEGYEQTVIAELAKSRLFPQISDLFFEVDEDWIEPEEIVAFLRNLGFRNFRRIGEGTHYDIHASR